MISLRFLVTPLRHVARVFRTTHRTLARVPEALEAIAVLPALDRRLEALEAIAFSTATLPEMHEEIRRLRGDTAALPQIDATLARMALLLDRVDANTAGVQQLAEVMVPLRGAAFRVGRLADRFPERRAAAAALATPSVRHSR